MRVGKGNTMSYRIGDTVTVKSWSIGKAVIIAIHPHGTIDVESLTTGKCYRLSGLG